MASRHKPHTINHELLKAVSTGDADLLAQVLGVWSSAATVLAEEGDGESCLLEGVTAEGSSALHIAASLGYLELVVMICTQNISLIEARNNLLDTPLICAARAGHVRVVDYIIRQEVGSTQTQSGGQEEEAPAVNPVLNARNSSGATAMHEAVRNGHESVLEKLMSSDARLAAVVDERGVSPLYIAVVSSRVDMVDILIRESRDGVRSPASYAGPHGLTALHAAVYASSNAQQMTESLQRWDPTLVQKADSSGRTALHLAAIIGNTQVVKLLVRNSLLSYIPDDDGLFPVHAAAIDGYSKAVREIMKICPSCDELVDKKQRNALHCAVEHGMVMVVLRICINSPKFVGMMNAGDADGNTPLHLSITRGHGLIFYILMMHTSVNIAIMNNAGLTPRDVAFRKLSNDYTYSLVVNLFMYISLLLCGAPRSYQARKLRDEPFLEDNMEESSNYTNVSQSLLYISLFVAAGSFAAAFDVPGGYTAEGGNARTVGLLDFVGVNSISFYYSTLATCVLVHGSLTNKRTRDHHRLYYLAISTVLVWLAVLSMVQAFSSAVRLSLYPSNSMVFYFSVLVEVAVGLWITWPILFVAFPMFLRAVTALRMRRLSIRQGILEALITGFYAIWCAASVFFIVERNLERSLSPMERSAASWTWNWLLSLSQSDEIFLHPT